MTWREDRDALIAQTMAFVQSVTGKQIDFAQYALPPAPPAAGPVEPGAAEPVAANSVAPSQQPKAQAAAGASSADPGKLGFSRSAQNAAAPSTPAATARPEVILPDLPNAVPPPLHTPGAFGTEPFTSIAGQIGLQRDMQTEIRSRVASFRAHQERFRRERQEYFSATLARLRASINDTSPPDTK